MLQISPYHNIWTWRCIQHSLQLCKKNAQRLNIFSSIVINHTRKYVVQNRFKLPDVFVIDELKNMKSRLDKYALMLVDPICKKTIDLLPDRRYHDLIDYIAHIPLKDRMKIMTAFNDLSVIRAENRHQKRGFHPKMKSSLVLL